MVRFGRFWTLANVLSLARVGVAIPAAWLIYTDGPVQWSLGLIVVGGITDLLDGKVARWTNSVTEWGKVLDPLCDKIAVLLIGVALLVGELIPLWFIGAVVARDLLIVAGGAVLARNLGTVRMSNWPGKTAATAVGITLICALLELNPSVTAALMWITCGLLLFSLASYVFRFVQDRKESMNNIAS